jgi:hypothetical protein
MLYETLDRYTCFSADQHMRDFRLPIVDSYRIVTWVSATPGAPPAQRNAFY